MKRILAFFLGLLPALVGAGNGPHSCVWGAACTFPIDIYADDGVDFAATADIAIPAGDIEWYCPGQAVSSGTLSVTEIAPRGFYVTVPGALTDCARFEVKVRDQDATPAYLAMSAHVETCGNASAAHVNCTSALSTHAATDIVTGGAIATTGGAVDNVTLVATTTSNTDMRGTDNASTHAATDIVSAGAITTAAGAVVNVTNLESLNATARSQIETEALDAQSAHRLNELVLNALTAQPAAGSLWGDVTEDSPITPGTQRFNAQALAEAPSGTGTGDVTSWNGVPLSTTNPLPNAAPGANGGLPTVNATSQLVQSVSAYEVTDKTGYQAEVTGYAAGLDFNANQQSTIQTQNTNAINNARLNELVQAPKTAQPAAGSLYGDLTQDSTTIPGTQQFTADALAQAPTAASLNREAVRNALGAFGSTVQTIQDVTNFVVAGTNVPTSAGDLIDQEYTVVFISAADNDAPSCHRQIQGFSAPTGLLTIPTPCTQNVAIGDEVIFLPNGAGAEIANVNVNNGQVETDLTVNVDGALSLGCMLSAINAVQTGAQTIVNGTDYTYRNPGDTENRVVATRTASGRTQATITCPAGL